jgi:hypothetical protein
MEKVAAKSVADRRQHKRFLPKDGILVAVFDTLAQIVDISETGLAFICVNWDDLAYDDHKLDILYEECEWLKDIPFRVVSRNILEDRFSSIGNLNIQRCSLKFGSLTPEQKTHLGFLLRNYTKGEA